MRRVGRAERVAWGLLGCIISVVSLTVLTFVADAIGPGADKWVLGGYFVIPFVWLYFWGRRIEREDARRHLERTRRFEREMKRQMERLEDKD